MYLLKSVLAISLIGLASVTALKYQSPERAMAGQIRDNSDSAFQAFQSAVKQYREQNQQYNWVEDCPPDHLSGDPDCVWDRKIDTAAASNLNSTNWESELVPSFMSIVPPMPEGYSWSMGENTEGLYVCLSAPNQKHNKYAYSALLNRYASGSLKIEGSCGSATGWSKETIETSTTSTISATLQI